MESFLFQASIYLGAAVIAVPIAARLGLGSVLGYLLAGIVIGPLTGLIGTQTQDLQHFAEFGVVMMLFLIGLDLEPRALWDMRHRLLGLGGLQLLLTMGAITWVATLMGQPWPVALAVSMALSLSSTAIVLQSLSEKNLMRTGGGRSAFSVLLTQDIAVIPMLALMPLLAITSINNRSQIEETSGSEAEQVERLITLIENLPGWGATLLTIGIIGGIVFAGSYLSRPLFRFIHLSKLPEMYTALALLIVIGIAFLMTLVGLSPALGTFLAGVVLANSEFRHELKTDIEPFKGLLLGLFFITVGAGIDFQVLWADIGDILGLTLLLMTMKGGILFLLGWAFKLQGQDRWLFTLGLAQAGEFGFVLISFAVQQNVMPTHLGQRLLIVIALSMLLTPLFFILYDYLSSRSAKESEQRPDDAIDEQQQIIIAGIGRFGQVVNRLVQSAGFKTVVLDNNLNTIQLMRKFGYKSFFGDPTRPELLRAAGLADASVLVVAIDDPDAAAKLVEIARRERPDLHIIARARNHGQVYRLYAAGADDIVRELFDSSLRAGRYVLENVGLSEFEAAEAEKAFFSHDRYAMRELAELWKPGVPTAENPEYIARANVLEKELETTLLAQIEAHQAKSKAAE